MRLPSIITSLGTPHGPSAGVFPTEKQIALWKFVTSFSRNVTRSPLMVGLGSVPPPTFRPSRKRLETVTSVAADDTQRRPARVAVCPGALVRVTPGLLIFTFSAKDPLRQPTSPGARLLTKAVTDPLVSVLVQVPGEGGAVVVVVVVVVVLVVWH